MKMKKTFIDEATKPANRINTYKCPKGHVVVFKEIHEGTTPDHLNCRWREGNHKCDQISISAWYECDQTLEPTFEFYRPEPGAKLTNDEKQYCKQGGLLMRRIGGELADLPEKKVETTGRNEPCPCGATRKNSAGETVPKKFKSCCINNPLFKAV